MNAEQLAAYFSKKVAKPITFAVQVQTTTQAVYWVYEFEVTAAAETSVISAGIPTPRMRATRR
jgi:hypothetical protein